MRSNYIIKGTRVSCYFLKATAGSLAGHQPKLPVILCDFKGTVAHVTSDHPTEEVNVLIHVIPDASSSSLLANFDNKEYDDCIPVKPEHITIL
jgi:hypothetical protein